MTAEEAPEPRRREHRGENKLNDLDPKEWLLATKSVWYQDSADIEDPNAEEVAAALRAQLGDRRAEELLTQLFPSLMLSRPPSRDKLKALHPATFPETDIARLIKFFTKERERVLDPFLGSGSTLVACRSVRRQGVGIELIPTWADVARQRLSQGELTYGEEDDLKLEVIEGDSRTELARFPDASFGFVVTSPPYWSVLNKDADHKVKRERLSRDLPTNYSEEAADLANIESYDEFLDALATIFRECRRVLAPDRYIAVVVSDFRDKDRFYLFHADVARLLEQVGLSLSGITILVQDSKNLYPYGMPYAFVSNIHHQYVVVARRRKRSKSRKKTGGYVG